MNRRIDRRSFVAWPFRGVSHKPLLDLLGECWLRNEIEAASSALDETSTRSLISSKNFGQFLKSQDHVLIREQSRGLRIDQQFRGWQPYWDVTSAALTDVGRLEGFAGNSFQSRLRDVRSSQAAMFELLITAGYCRSSWGRVKWTDGDASQRPGAGEFRAQHGNEAVFVECKAKAKYTTAGYCRSSWEVKWTDGDASQAGEFRAQHGNEAVFVECKAKAKYTERMDQMRMTQRQVSDALVKRLRELKLNYLIRFELLRVLRKPDYQELVRFAARLANSGTHRCSLYHDAILIHAIKLCNPGEAISQKVVASLVPRGDSRHEWSTVFHNQSKEEFLRGRDRLADDGEGYVFPEYTDPIALRFSSPEDVEGRLRGIYNAISSARRQLPSGEKGVIYIDAAIDDYQPQEQVFRRLHELIDGWLANCGSPTTVFETAAFVRSAISPCVALTPVAIGLCRRAAQSREPRSG